MIDAVVDHLDLLRRHGVAVDDDIAGVVADGDHPGGRVHALALDVVHVLIDMLAAAVELGGVNLHDQRLAAVGGQRRSRRGTSSNRGRG